MGPVVYGVYYLYINILNYESMEFLSVLGALWGFFLIILGLYFLFKKNNSTIQVANVLY